MSSCLLQFFNERSIEFESLLSNIRCRYWLLRNSEWARSTCWSIQTAIQLALRWNNNWVLARNRGECGKTLRSCSISPLTLKSHKYDEISDNTRLNSCGLLFVEFDSFPEFDELLTTSLSKTYNNSSMFLLQRLHNTVINIVLPMTIYRSWNINNILWISTSNRHKNIPGLMPPFMVPMYFFSQIDCAMETEHTLI